MPEIDATTRARLRDLEARVSSLTRSIDARDREAGQAQPMLWCFVKLNEELGSYYYGTSTTDSASCSVYQEDADGELVDTGADIEVFAPPLLSSGTVAAGRWGVALRWLVRWWFVALEGPC